ncbi:MAG TPA: isoprenylcysteine carboxylmethyltransferase family protein [Terracidiphilus sp.]|jgi:protein-S-isoprenylcysteine O-methyltransferase Ste14|nr:isoprenylcysteine carboxylmethyltransferase family protein [Terracidiphilus sp.]
MTSNPTLLVIPWLVLGAVWLVAAASQKAAVHRQPLSGRFLYVVLALLGFILLAKSGITALPGLGWLGVRFVPQLPAIFIAGFVLELAGALFAVWARLTLGGNWSGRPSLMANHELVTSGPYALARHPIYTGLLFAALGTALAIGEWRCLLGTFVLASAFLIKIQAEERLMMQAFADSYPAYRRRVKALIPGVL